jgi:hypothetical protein
MPRNIILRASSSRFVPVRAPEHQDSTAPRSSRFDAVNAEGESDENPAILKSFSGDFRRLLEVL